MMIEQTDISNIKDIIISPKGGICIIFKDNKKLYKPSEEYITKCQSQKHLLFVQLNYSQLRAKRIRDNKILFKYILPEMFRKLNLVMPRFDELNQKQY